MIHRPTKKSIEGVRHRWTAMMRGGIAGFNRNPTRKQGGDLMAPRSRFAFSMFLEIAALRCGTFHFAARESTVLVFI